MQAISRDVIASRSAMREDLFIAVLLKPQQLFLHHVGNADAAGHATCFAVSSRKAEDVLGPPQLNKGRPTGRRMSSNAWVTKKPSKSSAPP
jgi:hypothetical protein